MSRLTALATAAGVAMLLIGCGTNPITGQRELRLVSYEQAAQAGQNAVPEMEKEFGGPIKDAALQAYLQKMGERIARYVPTTEFTPTWRFTALDSDVVNAFAMPDGSIYFTRGILKMIGDEAELAAVMGHEMMHVAIGHTRRQLQQAVGLQLIVEAAGAGGGNNAAAAAKVAAALASLKFSRSDEAEADQYGMKYMAQAGYSPWGMVDLQQKLLAASGAGGGPEILSTHPSSASRIAAAEAEIAAHYANWPKSGKDQNPAAYLAATAKIR